MAPSWSGDCSWRSFCASADTRQLLAAGHVEDALSANGALDQHLGGALVGNLANPARASGARVGMEKQLYRDAFPQGVSLVLYDLTSVYFEGEGPLGISRYGHSRDHRSDRPQV